MRPFHGCIRLLAIGTLGLLTSCATYLGSGQQDVKIKAKGDSAQIYLDGNLRETGSEAKLTIEKSEVPHELEVRAQGYKPEHQLLVQQDGSWLRALSIFPFGPTIVAPVMDFAGPGSRAFNFKDVYNLKNDQLPFRDRKANQKYLHLEDLKITISDKDLRFAYSFNYDDFIAYKPSTFDQPISPNVTKRNLAKIEPAGKQLSSAYKGDTVKRILKQHHYYDTSGLLPDKLNTTFLKAELQDLTIHTGAVVWTEEFFPVTEGLATVSLELKNYYGQKLAEKEIYAETGHFAPGRHGGNMDEVVGLIFKDALYTSIAKFMNKETVQEHLQRESATTPEYETLVLERGDSISSLAEAKKATVTVQAGDDDHGSGFVIGEKGYILTNYHVVASESADSNLRVLPGHGQPLKADLIRKNANLDLALIKVDKPFDKTYRIPSKTEPERTNTAYAIGTPGSVELGQTLSKGIISGVRELDGNPYIQSDVSVNPGSSGGPLVNGQGHLLGVVTGKLTGIETEGVSFSLQAHLLDNRLGLQFKAE